MIQHAYSQHVNNRDPLVSFTISSTGVDTPLPLHLTIVVPNLILILPLEFRVHLPSLFWVTQQVHILSFRRYLRFLQTHPTLSSLYFCLRKFFEGIGHIVLPLLVCEKLRIAFLFLNQKRVTILDLILRVAISDCTALATTAAVSSVLTVSINFGSFFCLSLRVLGST